MTPFQKQIKKTLDSQNVAHHDAVVCKKDGSVEVKRSYFYRPSGGAGQWADDVSAQLRTSGVYAFTVECRDDFRNWPTTSYLVAIVKPV